MIKLILEFENLEDALQAMQAIPDGVASNVRLDTGSGDGTLMDDVLGKG